MNKFHFSSGFRLFSIELEFHISNKHEVQKDNNQFFTAKQQKTYKFNRFISKQ